MEQFQLDKLNALNKQDKSHEQKFDVKIKPLCDLINSKKDLYTTSSCSGRITIIPKTNQKLKNAFLFKSHNKTTLDQIKKIIHPLPSTTYYLRMEPAALHIATTSLEKAQSILNQARNLGWKKSGIISTSKKFIIELFSTEFLITPLTKDLPESYLQLLITEANEKLEQTWIKIEKLKEQIQKGKNPQ